MTNQGTAFLGRDSFTLTGSAPYLTYDAEVNGAGISAVQFTTSTGLTFTAQISLDHTNYIPCGCVKRGATPTYYPPGAVIAAAQGDTFELTSVGMRWVLITRQAGVGTG